MKKIFNTILRIFCLLGMHYVVDTGGGTLSFTKCKCIRCGKKFKETDYGLIDDKD